MISDISGNHASHPWRNDTGCQACTLYHGEGITKVSFMIRAIEWSGIAHLIKQRTDDHHGIMKSVMVTMVSFFLLLGSSGLGYGADERAMHRSSMFRCGNDLVSLGDSMADVMLRCGEPTYHHASGASGKARTIKRKSTSGSEWDQNHEKLSRKRVASRTEYEEKVAETWYYNRGPNDFVYSLHFEGGALTKIVQGNRGK